MSTRYKSMRPTAEEAVERALDEIEQDEAKYRRESFPPTRREIGFGTMFETARGSARTTEAPQPEPQTWCGFLRMLDPVYQRHVKSGCIETPDRTTPEDNHPVMRRGMGFVNMLEASQKGTE